MNLRDAVISRLKSLLMTDALPHRDIADAAM
jgi:hypothetical protein